MDNMTGTSMVTMTTVTALLVIANVAFSLYVIGQNQLEDELALWTSDQCKSVEKLHKGDSFRMLLPYDSIVFFTHSSALDNCNTKELRQICAKFNNRPHYYEITAMDACSKGN